MVPRSQGTSGRQTLPLPQARHRRHTRRLLPRLKEKRKYEKKLRVVNYKIAIIGNMDYEVYFPTSKALHLTEQII